MIHTFYFKFFMMIQNWFIIACKNHKIIVFSFFLLEMVVEIIKLKI